MIAFDTNLLVRAVVADDPVQAAIVQGWPYYAGFGIYLSNGAIGNRMGFEVGLYEVSR